MAGFFTNVEVILLCRFSVCVKNTALCHCKHGTSLLLDYPPNAHPLLLPCLYDSHVIKILPLIALDYCKRIHVNTSP